MRLAERAAWLGSVGLGLVAVQLSAQSTGSNLTVLSLRATTSVRPSSTSITTLLTVATSTSFVPVTTLTASSKSTNVATVVTSIVTTTATSFRPSTATTTIATATSFRPSTATTTATATSFRPSTATTTIATATVASRASSSSRAITTTLAAYVPGIGLPAFFGTTTTSSSTTTTPTPALSLDTPLPRSQIQPNTCQKSHFNVSPTKLGGILKTTLFQVSVTPTKNLVITKNSIINTFVHCSANFTSNPNNTVLSVKLNGTTTDALSFNVSDPRTSCFITVTSACGPSIPSDNSFDYLRSFLNNSSVGLLIWTIPASSDWTALANSTDAIAASLSNSSAILNDTSILVTDRASMLTTMATNLKNVADNSNKNGNTNQTAAVALAKNRDDLVKSVSNMVASASPADTVAAASDIINSIGLLMSPIVPPTTQSSASASSAINSVLSAVVSTNPVGFSPVSAASILTTANTILAAAPSSSSAASIVSSMTALSQIAAANAMLNSPVTYSDPTGSLFVTAALTSPSTMASVSFTGVTINPSSAFAASLGSRTVISSRAISSVTNPFTASQNASDNNVIGRSPVFQYSIFDATTNLEIPINNLATPFALTFANPVATGTVNGTTLASTCQFWDTTSNSWSTKGCNFDVTNSNTTTTICLCNHLTAFSVSVNNIAPNAIDPTQNSADAEHRYLIYGIGGFLLLIYAGTILYSWQRNRMNAFALSGSKINDFVLYDVILITGSNPNDATTARTYITLHGESGLSTPKMFFRHSAGSGTRIQKNLIAVDVGTVASISLSHDATGTLPHWRPVRAIVGNRTHGHLSEFDIDPSIATTGTCTSFATQKHHAPANFMTRMFSYLYINVQDRNIWLSTLTAPTSAFSHTERIATCFLMLYGNLGLGFYWHRSRSIVADFLEVVIVAVITSGIMLLISIPVTYILRNSTPHNLQSLIVFDSQNGMKKSDVNNGKVAKMLHIRWRYLTWVVMTLVTLGAIVLSVLAALYLDATNIPALGIAIQSFFISLIESIALSSNILVSIRSFWQSVTYAAPPPYSPGDSTAYSKLDDKTQGNIYGSSVQATSRMDLLPPTRFSHFASADFTYETANTNLPAPTMPLTIARETASVTGLSDTESLPSFNGPETTTRQRTIPRPSRAVRSEIYY